MFVMEKLINFNHRNYRSKNHHIKGLSIVEVHRVLQQLVKTELAHLSPPIMLITATTATPIKNPTAYPPIRRPQIGRASYRRP